MTHTERYGRGPLNATYMYALTIPAHYTWLDAVLQSPQRQDVSRWAISNQSVSERQSNPLMGLRIRPTQAADLAQWRELPGHRLRLCPLPVCQPLFSSMQGRLHSPGHLCPPCRYLLYLDLAQGSPRQASVGAKSMTMIPTPRRWPPSEDKKTAGSKCPALCLS